MCSCDPTLEGRGGGGGRDFVQIPVTGSLWPIHPYMTKHFKLLNQNKCEILYKSIDDKNVLVGNDYILIIFSETFDKSKLNFVCSCDPTLEGRGGGGARFCTNSGHGITLADTPIYDKTL